MDRRLRSSSGRKKVLSCMKLKLTWTPEALDAMVSVVACQALRITYFP